MPRSNRNDNFIDKSFTVMADLIVKLLPINSRAKEAYVYYRDGLSAQNDGDYAEALENYEESLKLEDNPVDRGETLKNMAIIYMSNGEEDRAIETYQQALDENPKQPSCLKNMGLIYESAGGSPKRRVGATTRTSGSTRRPKPGRRPCASIQGAISTLKTG